VRTTPVGAIDPAGFRFGVEHEVAFLNAEGRFADFTCTRFDDFQPIVDALPSYGEDEHDLRIGDAGIKVKRWYVEGFERFGDSPQPVDCVPKGIEIRTTIHRSITGVVTELNESLALLHKAADLNLSHAAFRTADTIDAARKLTAYSPVIVPFSFGSPFFAGGLWDGLSPRTFMRTGARPAALAFVGDANALITSTPSLTKIARLPAEVGRIEFKAFDSCVEPTGYAPLLALLKGLLIDDTLPDRADVPDGEMHRRAARNGFDDDGIARGCRVVLQAADRALRGDPDRALLAALWEQLEQRRTAAHRVIERFRTAGTLDALLAELAALP
jgi:hypothetical protein